jgi:hypothetical protein
LSALCYLEVSHSVATSSAIENQFLIELCCYQAAIWEVVVVLLLLSGECNFELVRQGYGLICALSGFT